MNMQEIAKLVSMRTGQPVSTCRLILETGMKEAYMGIAMGRHVHFSHIGKVGITKVSRSKPDATRIRFMPANDLTQLIAPSVNETVDAS